MTRDHVVPKTLWAGEGNLPPKMVTVPACLACQRLWDSDAEYCRNTLIAMIDRGAHPVADRALEGKVLRSLTRSQKAFDDFLKNVRPVTRKSPGGIIAGWGFGFDIDLERFARIPEKILRGLLFLKSHAPLPTSHIVRVFPGNGFWEDAGFQNLLAVMEPWAGFGDDVFRVRSVVDGRDPFSTAWLMLFYQKLAFFAWSEPREAGEKRGNS